MARVTVNDVTNILTEAEATRVEDYISTYIDTANAIVTGYLSGKSLSDPVLAQIEKFMAAHMLVAPNPNLKRQKVDVIDLTYMDHLGIGLKSTRYGQTAIMLDTSGTLADISDDGSKKTITIGSIDYNEND